MPRPPLDLSVYLVTDTAMCGVVGVAATVAEAVANGVTFVQLRDPDASDEDFVRLGLEVMAALEGSGVPLLLNDRVHLVEAVGAYGAHIGQGDLPVEQARAVLGDTAYLGLSVQTQAHLQAAGGHDREVIDYLGVGPVWAQRTKPDAGEPSGLENLAALVALSPWPVVAIGGVTAEGMPRVRQAGAAGGAVVSAICGQPDVGAAAARLRAAWDGAAR